MNGDKGGIHIPDNFLNAIRLLARGYGQDVDEFCMEAICCSIVSAVEVLTDAEVYYMCEKYNLWELWGDGGGAFKALVLSRARLYSGLVL